MSDTFIPAPLSGADLDAYHALNNSVVYFAREQMHHLEFTGAKAADALTGLVTNDVLSLAVGQGQYAAALTAKGRMVADLRIVRIAEETFLTSTSAEAWSGWRDIVRKYVNPRLAKYTERALHTISVHGPESERIVTALIASHSPAATLPSDTPYACTTVHDGEHLLHIVRSPELGEIGGYDVLVPDELFPRTHAALVAQPNLTPASPAVWDVARIESARPRFGLDMDDTTIPQEANLGALGALSFDKGCYTGQETVARVHFRGHVNRHLRLISGPTPFPVPSELRNADDKAVGEVRSSVISPRHGPLAIAMIRREFSVGDTLRATDLEGEIAALVLR